MKKTFLLLIILSLSSCLSKKGKLTFYIENGSKVDTVVNIKVLINENMKIDTVFKYSSITPNYDTFIVDEILKDSISIKGITSTGAIREFKIKFNQNAYIFLHYAHDSIMTKKEQLGVEKMKKAIPHYDPMQYLDKKALTEKVLYVEPVLY
jgi:hypothetical protein